MERGLLEDSRGGHKHAFPIGKAMTAASGILLMSADDSPDRD